MKKKEPVPAMAPRIGVRIGVGKGKKKKGRKRKPSSPFRRAEKKKRKGEKFMLYSINIFPVRVNYEKKGGRGK